MKTDRTAGISGATGVPLSHQTISSGQKSQTHVNTKTKPSLAISDTVETSDREADGRQLLPGPDPSAVDRDHDPGESGQHIDLTG